MARSNSVRRARRHAPPGLEALEGRVLLAASVAPRPLPEAARAVALEGPATPAVKTITTTAEKTGGKVQLDRQQDYIVSQVGTQSITPGQTAAAPLQIPLLGGVALTNPVAARDAYFAALPGRGSGPGASPFDLPAVGSADQSAATRVASLLASRTNTPSGPSGPASNLKGMLSTQDCDAAARKAFSDEADLVYRSGLGMPPAGGQQGGDSAVARGAGAVGAFVRGVAEAKGHGGGEDGAKAANVGTLVWSYTSGVRAADAAREACEEQNAAEAQRPVDDGQSFEEDQSYEQEQSAEAEQSTAGDSAPGVSQPDPDREGQSGVPEELKDPQKLLPGKVRFEAALKYVKGTGPVSRTEATTNPTRDGAAVAMGLSVAGAAFGNMKTKVGMPAGERTGGSSGLVPPARENGAICPGEDQASSPKASGPVERSPLEAHSAGTGSLAHLAPTTTSKKK